MTTIQTVCIFIGGYLVSRLLLRADGHEAFVTWLTRRSGGQISRIVLGLMFGAFFLSTFVPNALTVLALIPVVAAIRRGAGDLRAGGRAAGPPRAERQRPIPLGPAGGGKDRLGTLLAMGLIYGGNIGGLASLAGSPANLYLLVNLRIFKVAGRSALHFVSWLVFGMPMAVTFLVLCWGLFCLTERDTMSARVSAPPAATGSRGPLLPLALRWASGWLLFWITLLLLTFVTDLGAAAVWRGQLWGEPALVTIADGLGVGFTVLLVAALFAIPVRAGGRAAGPPRAERQRPRSPRVGDDRQPLMGIRDLWREVPVRGVAFGVAVLVLLVVIAKVGLVGFLERVAAAVVPEGVGPVVATLAVVLVTIFSTEVLSNTAVATVMFPLSAATAARVGLDPLHLMLAISLASTCAFMTPVATPVNALAFAGIGGVSFRTFVKNGVVANLAGALWITAWVNWLVPPVLRWFA